MPKVVNRKLYRKELLNGCAELFAQKGYGSITMRQIADGLGVSTGTLYHYFESKETIFMQLVQELCDHDISSFLAEAPEAESLEDRLQAILSFVARNLEYYQQQLLLWVDFFQQTQKGSQEQVHSLRQVQDRGREAIMAYLRISDPALTDFLMVFVDGLLIQCIYNRDAQESDWLHHQCQLIIQMVLNYE